MTTALTVLLALIAVALIAVITLQASKGEGLGAIGGGAQMFFTPQKGIEAWLNKLTVGLAVAFMLLALIVDLLVKSA